MKWEWSYLFGSRFLRKCFYFLPIQCNTLQFVYDNSLCSFRLLTSFSRIFLLKNLGNIFSLSKNVIINKITSTNQWPWDMAPMVGCLPNMHRALVLFLTQHKWCILVEAYHSSVLEVEIRRLEFKVILDHIGSLRPA